jgi:hypothetical protein
MFHVENHVVAEQDEGLLIFLYVRVRILPGITELFVEDSLRAFRTLSLGTFQLLRLYKAEPEWVAVGAGPK